MRLYRKFIRPVHCYPGQGYEPKTELIEKEAKWYPEEEREHLSEKYGYLDEEPCSNLVFEEKYEPYLPKEIVRCKDCKHFHREIKDEFTACFGCSERHNTWGKEWFCADAERK